VKTLVSAIALSVLLLSATTSAGAGSWCFLIGVGNHFDGKCGVSYGPYGPWQ